MSTLTLAPPPVDRFSFSKLLREPKVVTAIADKRPVYLDRRNAPDLILMSQKADEDNRTGIDLATSVIKLMIPSAEPIRARAENIFPWVRFLPEGDITEFADDLFKTTRACATLGNFGALTQIVHEWKCSAEAYEYGWDKTEYDWLEHPIPVPRPE